MTFSFIIITYNRPLQCIETLDNILSTTDYNKEDSEIIVIDNNENESNELIAYQKIHANDNIIYFKSGKNLGVAGGRNLGIKKSKGKILIFIDDDAEFRISKFRETVFDIFSHEKNIGVIAFKSFDYYKNVLVKKEFPHKDKRKSELEHFYTYYYIGVAHIILKEVIDKVGYYPEDFFYGMEEYDLSYRILDNDYDILYDSRFQVLHKNSKLGRKSSSFIIRKYSENKIKVALRNLPLKYVITHWFLWSSKYLLSSKMNIFGFFILQFSLIKYLKKNNRKLVSKKTISKIINDLDGVVKY